MLRVNTTDSIVVRPGTTADWRAITTMLEQAGLPTADLAQSRPEFTVLADAGKLIGIGALEYFGDVALLRSVAIAADQRHQGLGAELLAHIERRALERGAGQLVLLTQSAERFFSRHGYAPIPRASAPTPIQNTAEFRSLCPDSAICMSKRL